MQRDKFKKLFGYDAKDLTDNINQSVYYADEEKPVYEEKELQEILKGNLKKTELHLPITEKLKVIFSLVMRTKGYEIDYYILNLLIEKDIIKFIYNKELSTIECFLRDELMMSINNNMEVTFKV
jgi:hypothetical protein